MKTVFACVALVSVAAVGQGVIPAANNTVLVKQDGRISIRAVQPNGAPAADRVPVVVNIVRTGFVPMSPAPVIGTAIPDPQAVTAAPYSLLTGACQFANTDQAAEPDSLIFAERFASLRDLGTHTFSIQGGYSVLYVSNGRRCVRADPVQPCGWLIDHAPECRAPTLPGTFEVTVVNNPPQHMPLITPAPAFGVTSVFDARLDDPDPGSDTFPQRWTVTARPAGSKASLQNPLTSRPSIRFGTWQDVGQWRLGLSFEDNQGEMFLIGNGGYLFDVSNQAPAIAMNGADRYFVGETVSVSATVSDFEGAPLSAVSWRLTPPAGSNLPVATSTGSVVTRNGQPFIARSEDRGYWHFRAEVRDHLGVPASVDRAIKIENRKPTIMLGGNLPRYVMGQSIMMRANALDPDGGPVAVRWTVEQGPVRRRAQVISSVDEFNLPVVAAEIGQWEVRISATDDENETTEQVVSFVIENLPPRIVIGARSYQIGVNQTLQLATAVLLDDDGGPLTFNWTWRQLPYAAGSGPALGTREFASFGSPVAGTWIVRLEASDDDGAPNSTVSEDITIVVDDVPFVQLNGPRRAGPTNPWIDLHAVAEDPDSPCEGTTHRCHSTVTGLPQSISLGIVSYEWSVLGSPMGAGPIQDVIPSLGSQTLGPTIHLTASALPSVGAWTFGVTVRDGEGHSANSNLQIEVIPTTAPTAAVRKQISMVDQSGYALGNFIFDGSRSYDEDNRSDGIGWPGIIAHEWVFLPPHGCPMSPIVMYGPTTVLMPQGGRFQASCVGRWLGNLSVYDDDVSTQTGVFGFEFAVTSCSRGVCLESPRLLQPSIVSSGSLPVEIRYVVDAYLVDRHSLGTSGVARIQILDSRRKVVRTWVETGVRTVSKLATIVTTWDGLDGAGNAAPAGRYSVNISVSNGSSVVASDEVLDGIVLERPSFASAPSQLAFQVERFQIAPATFAVSMTGFDAALPQVVVSAELVDGLGRQVRDFGQLSGSPVLWDGRTTGGANAGGQVQAGEYQLRLRAARWQSGVLTEVAVQSLPVVVYSLRFIADVVGQQQAGTMPVTTVEHWTKTNPNPMGFQSAQLKMAPLTVEVRRGARVRLSAVGPTISVFALDGTQLTLPTEWQISDFSGGFSLTKKLLVHTTGLDDVELRLEYLDSAGAALGTERITIHPEVLGGFSGLQRATSPFVESTRRLQAGQQLTVGVSPRVFPDRVGKKAVLHVVPHRTRDQWAANRALGGAAVSPPQPLTVQPGSLAVNLIAAWPAAHVFSADSPLPHSQGFDVVLDFGNFKSGSGFIADGHLDPGDVLLSPDWRATVVVEDWTNASFKISDDKYSSPIVVSDRDVLGRSFDSLKMPLNAELKGRVVVPTGVKNYPLVVIGHGNHLPLALEPFVPAKFTSDENFEGYGYLQEFLAERGVASISVSLDDAYDSNIHSGFSGGIRLRAWLMLANADWALKNVAILADVDATRVYLVGHSRGGQAALDAEYLLAHPKEWPRASVLGLVSKDLRGVVALAPTSFDVSSMWTPRAKPVAVLHGTADGDVTGAEDNVLPSLHADLAATRSWFARFPGANHNFFNTSWLPDDSRVVWNPGFAAFVSYARPLLPAAKLVSSTDQREAAAHFVGRFLSSVEADSHFGGPMAAEPARLRNLVVQVRNPGGFVLDDFETGSGALTSSGTMSSWDPGVTVAELSLRDPRPAIVGDAQDRFFQLGKGSIANWGAAAAITFPVVAGQGDFRAARAVSVRVAQAPAECASRPVLGGYSISLHDSSGGADSFVLSDIGEVHTPEMDLGLLGVMCLASATFETKEVPISHFRDRGLVDLKRINRVVIGAAVGRVGLDDVEVVR